MESLWRQEPVSTNRSQIAYKSGEGRITATGTAPVTESTHRKVKTGLDETRLLILGAQILLGFHLNAAFQSGFAHLGGISRVFYTGAFCAMACRTRSPDHAVDGASHCRAR